MEFALVILALLGWWWYSGSVAHDAAILAARHACQRQALQLLDETVALQKIRLRRDRSGRMRLWREFVFEFTTTGEQRCQGYLELLGSRVLVMELNLPEGGLYEDTGGDH